MYNIAMNKRIIVWLTGPIETLLDNWKPSPSIQLNRQAGDTTKIIFRNDGVSAFPEFERIVDGLEEISMESPQYRATGFTDNDCRRHPLLWLSSTTRSGIGLSRSFGSISEMMTAPLIPFFTQAPLDGILVQTASDGWLFHIELLEMLKDAGLTGGLLTRPVTIENNNTPDTEWFWAYSDIDIGLPETERRFVMAFDRQRYNGEDFCTTNHLQCPSLLVSQAVYRLLRELPAEKYCTQSYHPYKQLELDFWPLELVG
jgi:hypothetical protein